MVSLRIGSRCLAAIKHQKYFPGNVIIKLKVSPTTNIKSRLSSNRLGRLNQFMVF